MKTGLYRETEMLHVNILDEGACYFNVAHRNWVALILLDAAYEYIRYSKFVDQIDPLAKTFDVVTFDDLETIADLHNELRKGGSLLINDILLSIALENYLKGKLLWRGFVIHIVDQKHDKHLAKRQKKAPSRIRDVKRLEGVSQKWKNDCVIDLLTDRTIGLHLMLNKPAYTDVLKVPSRITPFIMKLKEMRNTLHFSVGNGRGMSSKVNAEYRFVINWLLNKITKKHDLLIDKLGFPAGYKLLADVQRK